MSNWSTRSSVISNVNQAKTEKMKILVLGAGGMLGSAMFSLLGGGNDFDVWGTLRDNRKLESFDQHSHSKLVSDFDVQDIESVRGLLARLKPDVVINCIGVIKQLAAANDALVSIAINALLPHQLAELCAEAGARLVHFSTDCVFSGKKGRYSESDFPDANDLYGRSKFLGEVAYPHAITLRTSIIGHELGSSHSLVDWFLAQKGTCKGFTHAFFSGLPSVEHARIVRDAILPNPQLSGLYQVAAAPISKYDLLTLVAKQYGVSTQIEPSDALKIDRSLDGGRFNADFGYVPPDWPTLVEQMHQQFQDRNAGNVPR
ncbi:SDR family oxidoreductase [Herbaspirillum sp. WKF16]|uniref:dTDP-4-dehydrorhamnose reductase family protein n=1 Tax=Herbaspirillum sp. WKF16 TaxID=3028312 RepID=UPI0023A93DD4|nr:SDR family oxidoreductase [Herbaspirillum sp. WKF16]WDZ96610.1 SDR family oxidoreductase [Herbaspirillum sp. WKF16]